MNYILKKIEKKIWINSLEKTWRNLLILKTILFFRIKFYFIFILFFKKGCNIFFLKRYLFEVGLV